MAQTKLGSDGLNLISPITIAGGDQGSLILDHFYNFGSPNYALKLDGDTGKPGGYLTQYVTSGGFHLAQGATYYGGGPWKTDANSTSFAAVSGADGILYFHANTGLTTSTTFTPSERMRLDAGNLMLNRTSGANGRFHVKGVGGSANNGACIESPNAVQSLDILPGYALTNASAGGVQSDLVMTLRSSGSAPGHIAFASGNTEFFRMDSSGNLLAGITSGTYHQFLKGVTNDVGNAVAYIGTVSGGGVNFFATSGTGANAANASMKTGKDATTSRSINAAGTINASGADYAEYMTKAEDVGAIAKGAIVGVDVDGRLTDQWAAAVSFLIKSTDPSYVGGDVWGSDDALGMVKPIEPVFEYPNYTGAADPGDAPAEPRAPAQPELTPMPTEPTKPGPGASEMDWVNYLPALEEYQQLSQTVAAHNQEVQDAYNVQFAAYQLQLDQYQVDKASYDAALASYNSDREAYLEQVDSLRQQFDSITMPAYQADLAAYEALLEAARQKVDRMAYCGQVPVNVLGGVPGQYVVPIADGDGIAGELVDAAAVTFDQYRRAVGIVQNILPDGRANVRVKPV
jgi:hypothetical protein